MNYYLDKTVSGSFEDVQQLVTKLLHDKGFEILTEINMQQVFKKKLNTDFKKYTILGVCHVVLAHKALNKENKIGTMLPCNIIIQDVEDDLIEVAIVNPIESMQAVIDKDLIKIAQELSHQLEHIIHKL